MKSQSSPPCFLHKHSLVFTIYLTIAWCLLIASGFSAIGTIHIFGLNVNIGMFEMCLQVDSSLSSVSPLNMCYVLSSDIGTLVPTFPVHELSAAQAFWVIAMISSSVCIVLTLLLSFIPRNHITRIMKHGITGFIVTAFISVVIALGICIHAYSVGKHAFDIDIPDDNMDNPLANASASVSVGAGLALLITMVPLSIISIVWSCHRVLLENGDGIIISGRYINTNQSITTDQETELAQPDEHEHEQEQEHEQKHQANSRV